MVFNETLQNSLSFQTSLCFISNFAILFFYTGENFYIINYFPIYLCLKSEKTIVIFYSFCFPTHGWFVKEEGGITINRSLIEDPSIFARLCGIYVFYPQTV